MTSELMTTILIWAAILGTGVMTGMYLAFSMFIMPAFRVIDPDQGAAAMISINRVILKSFFMVIFFGSTLVSAVLTVMGFLAGNWIMVAASLLYVIGMFVVTAAGNVPLNNRLDQAEGTGASLHKTWSHYLDLWTRWNHLRSAASLASFALYVYLISGMG